MEEPCGEAWIVLKVLGHMVRVCEDGGMLEDSRAEVSMISLEEYGNDPSGGVFRSLHPCAHLQHSPRWPSAARAREWRADVPMCGVQPGMHWMMDWELKQLIREGSPSERGLACPQCRTPVQFARKLKWIQVATEAPARRRRAAVRIQARVRMRQVRKRVRAAKGLE